MNDWHYKNEFSIRSLIDLARGRIESGSASLMSAIDVAANDGVADILFRELTNAREQLHNIFEDNEAYVDLAKKFKQKAASATFKAEHSTAYLEALGQFNDGRIPGNSADTNLQVTPALTDSQQLQLRCFAS